MVGVTLEALNRRVFLEYVRKMNALREHPEFYNTLTTNCTTAILMNARVNPDSLPFSWEVLLSGYTPAYVYESGRIDQSLPFEELKRRFLVKPPTRHPTSRGASAPACPATPAAEGVRLPLSREVLLGDFLALAVDVTRAHARRSPDGHAEGGISPYSANRHASHGADHAALHGRLLGLRAAGHREAHCQDRCRQNPCQRLHGHVSVRNLNSVSTGASLMYCGCACVQRMKAVMDAFRVGGGSEGQTRGLAFGPARVAR